MNMGISPINKGRLVATRVGEEYHTYTVKSGVQWLNLGSPFPSLLRIPVIR